MYMYTYKYIFSIGKTIYKKQRNDKNMRLKMFIISRESLRIKIDKMVRLYSDFIWVGRFMVFIT